MTFHIEYGTNEEPTRREFNTVAVAHTQELSWGLVIEEAGPDSMLFGEVMYAGRRVE